MPSAMQNDVRMGEAEKIAASGVKYYIEVANMPTTNDALNYLRAQKHMIVAPSKLSMRARRRFRSRNEPELRASGLDGRRSRCAAAQDDEEHPQGLRRGCEEYGLGYDLVAGANIAGFKKVAQAMYEQGVF